MTFDLRAGPLEFGALWAAALVVIGLRLRRLGKEQPPGPGREPSPAPTGDDTSRGT